MNKNELVATIAAETGVLAKDVSAVLKSLKKTAAQTVREGGEIKIVGTGRLFARTYEERTSRNPKTGETVIAKATVRPAVKFTDSFMEEE